MFDFSLTDFHLNEEQIAHQIERLLGADVTVPKETRPRLTLPLEDQSDV